MFQFQSGAVKSTIIGQAFGLFSGFQFQSGAVKSRTAIQSIQQFLLFQFQSGAVKRVDFWIDGNFPYCFNSKVVRLKGGQWRCDD